MTLKQDWNYVKNVMQTPCHNGDFGLYVETGFAAAGVAALDILSLGCREPLKHAAGHGQVRGWFGPGIRPESAPPHRRPKAPKGTPKLPTVRAGPSLFWGFQGLAERALFYWMLADVTKDFFLNWTSLLYAANGCAGPAAGHCVFSVTPQVVGPNPTDLLIGALPDCHGVLSDIRAVYIPNGLVASIGYHLQCQPWDPAPNPSASVNSYLADDDAGTAYAASSWTNGGGSGNGTTGFQKNIPAAPIGFKRISIRAATGSGYAWISKGQMHVTLQGHAVKMFPLSDCFKGMADKKDGHRGGQPQPGI